MKSSHIFDTALVLGSLRESEAGPAVAPFVIGVGAVGRGDGAAAAAGDGVGAGTGADVGATGTGDDSPAG